MIRLILPVLFLLVSLLAVIKAPTNFFWRMQVAVTEFPVICIPVALILFVTCFWLGKYKTAALLISATALVLFCVPVVRAYMQSDNLRQELLTKFNGEKNSRQLVSPFSFWKMFSGIDSAEVVPQGFEYKNINGKGLTLDYYHAVSASPAPCVIVIHGGSWSSGDNKQIPELNSYLANQGYNVASITYRLAPAFKSPAPVEDTRDVIRYLKDHATELNLDTNNFVLLGRSAGGQIALCAAYTLEIPEIKGVISIYAPADMVWGAKIKGNKLVLDTDHVFAEYLGGSFDEFEEKYYESSGVHHVKTTSPSTLIIHGDNDCMVSFIHSEHLDSALTANNVPHYFLNLPGATHGCDYNLNGPSGQLSAFAIERFLVSCFRFPV